jgi:hypothetical protein
MAKEKTPEARLAAYWRRRADIAYSDFDVFDADKPAPPGGAYRSRYWIMTRQRLDQGETSFVDAAREIAMLIMGGYPLNFFEYHVAVACGYLLADGIAYEDFYTHHWYETADKRGYGVPPRRAREKPADAAEDA